jgi:hypothetical protein
LALHGCRLNPSPPILESGGQIILPDMPDSQQRRRPLRLASRARDH